MKKQLSLALLSVALFYTASAGAANGSNGYNPGQQPGANGGNGADVDYSVYAECRKNGGYAMQDQDGNITCIPFGNGK